MTAMAMAFDFDGTILFERGVSAEDQSAIARWQQAGNLAVACTGKSIYAARYALKDTSIRFDYNVLYTGAVVTDGDYTVLYKQTLPVDIVRSCVEKWGNHEGLALFATSLEYDFRLGGALDSSTSILAAFEPLAIEDLESHEYVGIPFWIPDVRLRDEVYEWILASFGERIDCHKNQDFLDIVPPASSKGTGLAWLAEHLKPEHYSWVSVGDSYNDIPMHRWADLSASFEYSPLSVKSETDRVIGSAHELIDDLLEHPVTAQ